MDAASVVDDEETVQHTERRGRHGEEVDGNDGLTVVVKKCKPFLGELSSDPAVGLNHRRQPSSMTLD
jgi:hypothetical protein